MTSRLSLLVGVCIFLMLRPPCITALPPTGSHRAHRSSKAKHLILAEENLRSTSSALALRFQQLFDNLEILFTDIFGGNEAPPFYRKEPIYTSHLYESSHRDEIQTTQFCFPVTWYESYLGLFTLPKNRTFPCATPCKGTNSSYFSTCSGVDYAYRVQTRGQAKSPYRPWYDRIFAQPTALPDLKDHWPCVPCRPQLSSSRRAFPPKCAFARDRRTGQIKKYQCDKPRECDYDFNWGTTVPKCRFWENRARPLLRWGGFTPCEECKGGYYATEGTFVQTGASQTKVKMH